MTKVTIEFDSIEEAQTAFEGHKWKLAMWDLDQELRNTTKYGKSVIHSESGAPEFEIDIAEKYREMLREILDNYRLVL
jgi:hypothetical protein